MKAVYSAANITLVTLFRNILEGHGIGCWITNEFLVAGSGEIPPIECWPRLCVDDADFPAAQRIVQEALSSENTAPSWKCASCGEDNEGQFSECWKCGKSLDPPGEEGEERL